MPLLLADIDMHPAFTRIVALVAVLGAPGIAAQVRQLDHVGAAGGTSFHSNSSHGRAMSRNGRFVVFRTNDATLVPGSGNGHAQVYLVDRETRAAEFISVGLDGPGNGDSLNPTISHDGRHIAFWSEASNLVAGDSNNLGDIFVRDRVAGTTTRVNVGPGNLQATADSNYPAISGDGRFVAFMSEALEFANNLNGQAQVFVHDRNTGTTELISRTPQNDPGLGISREPALSGDGRYIAFESNARDLAPGDGNFVNDIFVFDRVDNTMTRVSNRGDGSASSNSSYGPSISDDGRIVAFHANGSMLPEDTNGSVDGYVFDRATQVLRRVTLSHLQGQLNFGAFYVVVSGDGLWVAFTSSSSDTVPGAIGGIRNDIYVRRLSDGLVRRASVNSNGVQPDDSSNFPTIGRDGTLVGFASQATNLVPTVGAPTTESAVYVATPAIDEVNADGFE